MNLFHKKDQYQGYNIYSMKKYVDKKRIIFTTIIVILIIITLGFIIYYSVDTTIRLKSAKRFEQKLIEYESKQEEYIVPRAYECVRKSSRGRGNDIGRSDSLSFLRPFFLLKIAYYGVKNRRIS